MRSVIYKSTCQKCGQEIELGRTKYDVHVEVVSDFDGFLPDFEDEEAQTKSTLRDAEAQDARALEDEVHQEFTLTLCRACMHDVVGDLRAIADGDSGPDPAPGSPLH